MYSPWSHQQTQHNSQQLSNHQIMDINDVLEAHATVYRNLIDTEQSTVNSVSTMKVFVSYQLITTDVITN